MVAVLLFTAFMLLSLVLWSLALGRLAQQRPMLDAEPRQAAPWGFLDLLVTVLVLIGVQFVAMLVLRHGFGLRPGEDRSIEDYIQSLLASAVCSVLAFLISWGLISWRTGATTTDLGLTLTQFGRDLRTGVAAFIMLAPIVFTIQLIVVSLKGPTQHPFILLLQESPDMRLFLVTSLNAVAIAPIVEEYFFRSLWQGWTESLRWPFSADEALLGRRRAVAAPAQNVPGLPPAAPSDPFDPNPYRASLLPDEEPVLAETSDPQLVPMRTRWLPIVLSSALFSLAHYNHGYDFIPLFVLAIGLGYLYQRTHRLVPCIVVHLLLNGTSMALLWAQLFAK